MPFTKDASSAFDLGSMISFLSKSFNFTTIGRTPLRCFTFPSSESSPHITLFLTDSWLNMPFVTRIPMAIGRSNPGPPFFILAGARFTVILFGGNSKPEFFIAAFILSLLSLIAVSGSPTIEKPGSPPPVSTSTSTTCASMPLVQHDSTLASI